jgi:hypothetical protein
LSEDPLQEACRDTAASAMDRRPDRRKTVARRRRRQVHDAQGVRVVFVAGEIQRAVPLNALAHQVLDEWL